MSIKKISVAQIRGDGLSDREVKVWKHLPADIVQTIFAPRKNIFSQFEKPFPTIMLRSSSDNFFSKNLFKYCFGQYRRMFGLEKKIINFDIVHTGEIFNYYTYQAVKAKILNKKLKVVTTVWENSFGRFDYNYWPGFKSPPNYWLKKIKKIIFENSAGVDIFLPATNDAAGLLLDCGVSEKKIRVVTPGIISEPKNQDNVLPANLVGKELYLMVNRLVKEKGVYDVLYGWRLYLSKVLDPSKKFLVIVGQGPELKNMKRIIKNYNISSSVIFLDQLPYTQVLTVFKKARCLILASIPNSTWQEQFGYVLAESICAGTPVISTYCGAIPEVIGRAGLLVSPAHPIDISRALIKIDDADVYNVLKLGCLYEMKKFSAQKYADAVSDVYRNLVNI